MSNKVATDVAPEVKATLERLAKEKGVTLAALVRDMLTYATSELGGIPKMATPPATLTDPELHRVPGSRSNFYVADNGNILEPTATGWMCPRCKIAPSNAGRNQYRCTGCGKLYVRN